MRSRWSLDPEIKAVLEGIPPGAFAAPEVDPTRIPEIREGMRRASGPLPEGVRHTTLKADTGSGEPPVELHVFEPAADVESPGPGTAGRPVLLWIHGGGYIVGTGDEYGRVAHWLDRGYVVVAPEYRLAPEHPFPAGLHDCFAALEYVIRAAADLRADLDHLVVAGGSAGGGLAAALAVLCRDRGIDAIRHLVLLAPMVDDRTEAPGEMKLEVWGGAANRVAWDAYLSQAERADLPRSLAAVARVEDLSGLPPTTITVGTADLFCQETIALAGELVRSSVPVDLHVYAGLPHGFDALAPDSQASRTLQRDVFESIDRAFRWE